MQDIFFVYIIIVFSAVFHEYAHAWTANQLGDPTAKYAGRLTLNPIPHLDPFGTVLLPLFLLYTGEMFLGWANPVPFNPYNLNRSGPMKVALAGPISNFILALIFGLLLRFSIIPFAWIQPVSFIVMVNLFLGLFNLIPVPPLDGSKILFYFFPRLSYMERSPFGIVVAILIAFFVFPKVVPFIYSLIVGI